MPRNSLCKFVEYKMARDRGSLLSRHEADEAIINGDFRLASAAPRARAHTHAHTPVRSPSPAGVYKIACKGDHEA